MCIEESEENEAEDQHFVEAHIKRSYKRKTTTHNSVVESTSNHKGVDNGKSTTKGNGDGTT
jgi:hypothetical protein